ncbi:hypothetical protein GGR21_003943 [Dysgonomonas hofstadii]|uniref:Fibronectin type III-like domain-containing protein n=1 Tax=Dysgonomonas hofstadii TaxID=637886 RepID=A0A840CRG3_9BACT|nr:hypothetical protein [Dysgonomonas hofstadii]
MKHFKRLYLKKGEEKRISFFITKDDLSIINKDMQAVVESGEFTFMVGTHSKDIRVTEKIVITE